MIAGYALLTRLLPDWVGSWDPDRRLPALRADRLLERPRPLRGDGRPARRSASSPARATASCRPLAGAAPVAARADDAVHVQPRRLARARGRASRPPSHSTPADCSSSPPRSSLLPGAGPRSWLASRSDALTTDEHRSRCSRRADEGGSLLVWIVALAASAPASPPWQFRLLADRTHLRHARTVTIGGIALAAAAVAAHRRALAVYGGAVGARSHRAA